MPLQNRVDPYGIIFRTSARGTIMGNRGGALHNDHRELVRTHLGHRWITCLLEFKGIRRVPMTPHRYTELFFLDEATSFAAGHRPCAECRRGRFNAYRDAFGAPLRAPAIDAELHRARIDSRGHQVTFEAPLASLPGGVFIRLEGRPCLLWNGALHPWTPERYTAAVPLPVAQVVTVLTPAPTVGAFRRGYIPGVHPTAY
jgi:hypothetical protein